MPKDGENSIEFLGHPYDKNHLFICFETPGFPQLVIDHSFGRSETRIFYNRNLKSKGSFFFKSKNFWINSLCEYLRRTGYFTPNLHLVEGLLM